MDIFEQRRRGLEEGFFAKQNRMLLEKMRSQKQDELDRETFRESTGIADPQIIDILFQYGIRPETAIALNFLPLIRVAWADGTLSVEEKKAILEAAKRQGLANGSGTVDIGEILAKFIAEKPSDEVQKAWELYIKAMKSQLSEAEFQSLSKTIIDNTTAVAEAAGGILGVGSISKKERIEIEAIQNCF